MIVVAQLVEQSLRTPEACSSNRVLGKIYIEHLLKVNCINKTKIKKTEAGDGPFLAFFIFSLWAHRNNRGLDLNHESLVS